MSATTASANRPASTQHLAKLVPTLAAHGFDDVALNTAITRENLPSLRAIYERAKQWGVSISYSAYTPLRTHSMDHYIQLGGRPGVAAPNPG